MASFYNTPWAELEILSFFEEDPKTALYISLYELNLISIPNFEAFLFARIPAEIQSSEFVVMYIRKKCTEKRKICHQHLKRFFIFGFGLCLTENVCTRYKFRKNIN